MSTLTVNQHTPVDATAGPITMTLPTGAASGSQISCEKYDSTANVVTVSGSIRGSAGTITLSLSKETIAFTADSAGSWWPTSDHKTLSSLSGVFAPPRPGKTTTSAAASLPWFNALDFGAKGDGSTDDYAAIQAAITYVAAHGLGAVYIPGGYTFKLSASLTPANGVSIIGDGPTSVLAPAGAFSAIQLLGSSGSPLSDAHFRNFKIDGTNQTGSYSTSTKGIYIQYLQRCIFDSLQVVNCIATGIGVDFLQDCTISQCVTNSNGRLWTAGAFGGAGIGIGVGSGTSFVESWSVMGCHAESNGSYGIFAEAQNSQSTVTGARIIGNYCKGNSTAGIGVSGSYGTLVQGNVCFSNGHAGTNTYSGNISIDAGTVEFYGAQRTVISGNVCANGPANGIVASTNTASSGGKISNLDIVNNSVWSNGTTSSDGTGILLNAVQQTISNLTIRGNRVYLNNGDGIVVGGSVTMTNITVDGNASYSNGSGGGHTIGIRVTAPVTGLQITNNQCFNASGAGTSQTYGLVLTTGITLTTGLIAGNDFRGNATGTINTASTLSDVTFRGNPGYNPVGSTVPGTAFALAATAVAWTNNTGVDGTLYVTAAGTVTAVSVNGVAVSGTMAAGDTYRVAAEGKFTVTYSSAPTLVFVGD